MAVNKCTPPHQDLFTLLHRSPTIPRWECSATELPTEGEAERERSKERQTCPTKQELGKHRLIIP